MIVNARTRQLGFDCRPSSQGIARYMPREAMGGGRNAPVMPELSGKMFVLWRLMRQMRMPGNGADVRFMIITM